jgi:hypothetical protein
VLIAIVIAASSLVVGIVAATRHVLWKIGDSTRKLSKDIKAISKTAGAIPEAASDAIEYIANNMWIAVAVVAGVILYNDI